jgi:hypothetical protein
MAGRAINLGHPVQAGFALFNAPLMHERRLVSARGDDFLSARGAENVIRSPSADLIPKYCRYQGPMVSLSCFWSDGFHVPRDQKGITMTLKQIQHGLKAHSTGLESAFPVTTGTSSSTVIRCRRIQLAGSRTLATPKRLMQKTALNQLAEAALGTDLKSGIR